MPAVPSWPDDLLPSPPLEQSYQITFPDNLARTEMEQGVAIQRNAFRPGTGLTQYAVTWPMLAEQFGIFRGIQRWLLAASGRWFSIKVYEGAALAARTVRFVKGPIAPTRQGGEWMTSAVMETYDDTAPDEATTVATLQALGSAISALDDLRNGAGIIVWPSAILTSAPLNDNYTLTLPDDIVRSDLAQGFQDQDSPFRSGVTQYAQTWNFTGDQFTAFHGLLRWALDDGNAWFLMPMFDRENYFTRRVRIVKASIVATRDSQQWMIALTLETGEDTAMDYATTQAALA